VQNRNSIGPRTDPCSTPHKTTEALEVDRPQRTDWMQSLRYDVNHSSTLPPIPYDVLRLCRNVSWSSVSNAADKSSNINTATLLVSNADRTA